MAEQLWRAPACRSIQRASACTTERTLWDGVAHTPVFFPVASTSTHCSTVLCFRAFEHPPQQLLEVLTVLIAVVAVVCSHHTVYRIVTDAVHTVWWWWCWWWLGLGLRLGLGLGLRLGLRLRIKRRRWRRWWRWWRWWRWRRRRRRQPRHDPAARVVHSTSQREERQQEEKERGADRLAGGAIHGRVGSLSSWLELGSSKRVCRMGGGGGGEQ
eukprot:SAG11_NODE_432_length_9520_cov_102.527863_5_plen_213_part_00